MISTRPKSPKQSAFVTSDVDVSSVGSVTVVVKASLHPLESKTVNVTEPLET